ncbi:putative nuclease HARBI1 [Ylistrum balloti]|uniref:putative nuclease HARBI1 n=1 Tax=Ylistrum balloti TaxID=509963 RepID=UPI002905EFB0|nr:putative nuclease HARBI1 [Ylistrum balloti]
MATISRLRRRRRKRIFLPRVSIEDLSDEDIFSRYRFSYDTFLYIVDLIKAKISRPTNRNYSLSPLEQVLLTLRFLSTGAFFRLIGDSVGISESQVSRTVFSVCSAISSLARQFIHMPVGQEAIRIKSEFFRIAGFPNVLSCIDGTFIKIQAPHQNEADFVNRKGYHSLNVQMACDSKYRITNVVANWPGSVHDARIFRGSNICFKFENGNYDGILLGDSGYPCMTFLMTPYSHPSTPSHTKYNDALCKTRVKIEQTFGILKRKFACLSLGLRVEPIKAATITLAVLHNIGIARNDIVGLLENYEESDSNGLDSTTTDGNGNAMRDHIRITFSQ